MFREMFNIFALLNLTIYYILRQFRVYDNDSILIKKNSLKFFRGGEPACFYNFL